MLLRPGEVAAALHELHEQERLGEVIDLWDREVALIAEVAEHVRLALQVRLAGAVYLRDRLRAIRELRFVHPADAGPASSRSSAPARPADDRRARIQSRRSPRRPHPPAPRASRPPRRHLEPAGN